jgi:hypothetical protein
LIALRERYFHDNKDNAQDFDRWKVKSWELVDITCLPPILVIGIYRVVNQVTEEGTYTATKLNDNFDIPVVRSSCFKYNR